MRPFLAAFVIFTALATSAPSCSVVPVVQYADQPILTSSGKPPALERVRQAVVAAAVAQGWTLATPGDGELVATLVVRGRHTIVFDIKFTTEKYSLTYKDSTNMKYEVIDGVGRIHPNCNAWTQDLVNAINRELLKP